MYCQIYGTWKTSRLQECISGTRENNKNLSKPMSCIVNFKQFLYMYVEIVVISRVIERLRRSIAVGDDFDIWISFSDSIVEL